MSRSLGRESAATGDIAYGVSAMELPKIRNRLAGYEPAKRSTAGMRLAGVSMVLRDDVSEPEVLLIERATRRGDPWSGHMAFPGGRADPDDASLQHTAERETHEEVGFRLDDAELIGRLDDLSGRAAATNRMVVSAYVFHAPSPATLALDAKEVADAMWVPLRHLIHPENHVHYPMQYGGHEVVFPGIGLGPGDPRVVWGLTYRFLEIFFEVIGHPMPEHGIPDPEEQTRGG